MLNYLYSLYLPICSIQSFSIKKINLSELQALSTQFTDDQLEEAVRAYTQSNDFLDKIKDKTDFSAVIF